MKTPSLLVAALLLVVSPRAAAAQDTAAALESPQVVDAPAAESTAPTWRLDVEFPSVGLGWFAAPAAGYDREIANYGGNARIVSPSGHGGLLRIMEGTNVWGSAIGAETDYLFRVRLVGDDRFGLGLDTSVGATVAWFSHNEGTLPTGLALGGNAGLSLDFRAYGFVVSLGAQYHLLVPTEGALNGGPSGAEHAITGTIGLGFGFWGT